MKNEPDYELFEDWFRKNGGLVQKMKFPTFFPPGGCIGLSASEDVKPN